VEDAYRPLATLVWARHAFIQGGKADIWRVHLYGARRLILCPVLGRQMVGWMLYSGHSAGPVRAHPEAPQEAPYGQGGTG
jgi:hypothetical protein